MTNYIGKPGNIYVSKFTLCEGNTSRLSILALDKRK